jgi:hypothetical protein
MGAIDDQIAELERILNRGARAVATGGTTVTYDLD